MLELTAIAKTGALAMLVLGALTLTGCQDTGIVYNPQSVDPPIYVSIVIHNEETPQYIADEQRFQDERDALIAFADMLDLEGVMLNWQSDWTFLRAVQLYDDGSGTGGLNIVAYIASLGFEVDPHAHESQYNYADVAHMIDLCGVTPSGVAGGFIAYPPADCLLEQFWSPIQGAMFPAQSWTAQVLWGGATSGHTNEEHLWASGIWRPQDNSNFMTHDDTAPIAHIGKYGNDWTGLDMLIQKQQDNQLDTNKLYTAVVFVRQGDLTGPNHLSDFQQDLQTRDNSGNLIWVGLTEVYNIWQSTYGGDANQFSYP